MKKINLTVILLTLFSLNLQAQSLTVQIDEKIKKGAAKADPVVKKEFARAIDELRASGIEKSSLQKGVKAPAFHIGGRPLKEILKEGPVVLKFFRGSWCPYCVLELKAYQKHYYEIKKKGYQLIFLTPEKQSLVQKTIKRYSLEFPIHTDINNSIAKKFGIAFKLDEKVNKLYKKFGIELDVNQDNKDSELPMPGTYVIQKDGKISYAFADADYRKRVDPIDLLKEL